MSNLMVFENHNVEVFEWNGQVLFNPYHCGECLDLTEEGVKSAIKRMNSNQVIKLRNVDISKGSNKPFRKLHNTGENFLTESGVYKLIFKSKKKEAEKFQDWVTDEVLPQIRKTGGYIPIEAEMSEAEIMAKALLISQRTIEQKDKLLKEKEVELVATKGELEDKNRFIGQISASKTSMLVRDVAHLVTKNNIKIGEKRLWMKLREWGLIFKESTKPKQRALEQGLFEVSQFAIQTNHGVTTKATTRVTAKGQVYIIKRLLKEGI